MPSCAENERIKRQYFTYLREAKHLGERTLDSVARGVALFETFTKGQDFRKFRIQQAIDFKAPVSFDRPPVDETLGVLIYQEILQLRPWYDLAFERRRRSTFGEAGLTIEQVVDFLLAWATGPRPESPHAQLSSPQLLKLGAEELKVFYLEAVAARPGAISGRRAADWFWGETAAAHLLVALREVCIDAVEPDIRWMGRNLIVPRDQWSRFGIEDRWWKTAGRPSEASD